MNQTNLPSVLAFLIILLLLPVPNKKSRETWTDESFSVDDSTDSDFDE